MLRPVPAPYKQQMMLSAACTICAQMAPAFGAKYGFEVYRCHACRHVFVWPMPDEHLRIYSAEYFAGGTQGCGYIDYDRDKEPMIPTFHQYLDRLAHYTRPGRLIDIGAATGFFLGLARQRGWEVAGIEPSEYAASLARSKGLDVRTAVAGSCQFPQASFDAITMWDVIEHIPDPRRAFSSVATFLKPGGLIALNTPNSESLVARALKTKWHLVVPPEHLNLFSKKSLRRLLEDHGFELLEMRSIGKRFTVKYVLMTLSHRQKLKLLERATRAVSRRAVGQWAVPINLHDNVFVVARKR
jgi:2-polyprenyl-3-methyl-5-hydroxy-6-metoxy-1,4-benzoquinol methylase